MKECQHTDSISSTKIIQDKYKENHISAYHNHIAGKQR